MRRLVRRWFVFGLNSFDVKLGWLSRWRAFGERTRFAMKHNFERCRRTDVSARLIRRIYSTVKQISTLYLFLMTLIQLSSDLMAIYKMNNIFFAHYYFIGQFILLSLFFKQLLKNTFQKKAITFVRDISTII